MLTVTNIRREQIQFGVELRATIICEEDERLRNAEVWLRYPTEYYENISLNANAFVAAVLLSAMHLGVTVRVKGVISKKMCRGIDKFMEIMHQWNPRYKPVEIDADKVTETCGEGQFAATFFSGGVDSFYTLLKNEKAKCPASEKISHLIFVRGFDISLDKHDQLFNQALKGVKATAEALGKKVIQVSTNIRQITDHLASWSWYHSQALMSVALGLDGLLKRVYIPSTHTYSEISFPWGSHPLLDPLWTTESLDVVHDGCEATRVQKVVEEIAGSQVALDNLRVCWEHLRGKYNCGVCQKCIQTMVQLEIAGVLSKCKTFDRKLNYGKVSNAYIGTDDSERLLMQQNYDALARSGENPQLLKALSKCLSPWARWRPKNIVRSLVPKLAIKSLIIWVDKKVFGGRIRDSYRKIFYK